MPAMSSADKPVCTFTPGAPWESIVAPPTAAPSMPTGLAAWYDANDINAGGAQPANGALISLWLDKSGNSRQLGRPGAYNSDPNLNTAGPLPRFFIPTTPPYDLEKLARTYDILAKHVPISQRFLRQIFQITE